MKKAKMMLAAVAVFAVIGGAFAFKAQSAKTFYSNTAATAPCTVPFNTTATLVNRNLGTVAAGVRLSTTSTTAACPLTTLYIDTIQ
jgi:hypothetical protein